MSTLQFEEALHQELETLRASLLEAEEESAALRSQYSQLRELVRKSDDESKQVSSDLKEAKEKEQQLERVIQFLRKRTEESHLGINDLDAQYQKTQTALKSLTDELEKSRKELQDLNQALDEVRHEKDLVENTNHSLQGEIERLKTLTQTDQQINFDNELKERDANIETLRSDLDRLRHQALKEIQIAQEELRSKENILKDTYESKSQEIERKEKDYQQQILTLQDEKSLLNRQLEETNQAILEKRHLEDAYAKLQLEYQHTTHRLHEVTNNSKTHSEDLEARLRMAQQHLAKRVREAALLNEKSEEQRSKILDMQGQLTESKLKVTELQNTLEVETQHYKRSHDKMSESLHHLESQLEKWEKKYFQLHEKWQEGEEHNQKLRRTEEKFYEMQSLLGQLGNLIGNPHFLNTASVVREHPKMIHNEPEPIKTIHTPFESSPEQLSKKKQQDPDPLFETHPAPTKYKDSLFD